MTQTVLVVDDSASIRQMVGVTLKTAGYQVLDAADGEQALAAARASRVDLVLTDHNMPRMDGLHLVRNLRVLAQYKTVPILMLTTEAGDEMKAQGRAAGASGWLVKPFDPSRLLEIVKKLIG